MADSRSSPYSAGADEYEKLIRKKVWESECLTAGEWVYLVGLFQMAREHDDVAAEAGAPTYLETVRKVAAARERGYAAARANLQEAWSALAMVREAIETLAPSGSVKAAEHLDGPTFMHEAEALVAGIMAMSAVPQAVQEPVSYRWRQPGNKHWIYDPAPEWIEDHKHEIELEPLYTGVAQPSPSRHTAIERAIRSYCRRQSSAASREEYQSAMAEVA